MLEAIGDMIHPFERGDWKEENTSPTGFDIFPLPIGEGMPRQGQGCRWRFDLSAKAPLPAAFQAAVPPHQRGTLLEAIGDLIHPSERGDWKEENTSPTGFDSFSLPIGEGMLRQGQGWGVVGMNEMGE
ncbi:MAG: hypothetical protein OEV94_03645 [Deltaproteobacteria bacterium]|nr:hypothetical protein [Deltaproteobacteria bacterium]